MKLKGLADHYDKLTAQERLGLVLAATARGDEAERGRLMQAAPQISLGAPHHFWLTEAFLRLSQLHYMELLDLAGAYLAAVAGTDDRDEEGAEASWNQMMQMGYVFNVTLKGWRRFCAGLNFEAEVLWNTWPGYRTVRKVELMATHSGLAWTRKGACRWRAREELGEGAKIDAEVLARYPVLTARQVEKGLLEDWKELTKQRQ